MATPRTIQLILDAAQAIRSARELDTSLDRAGRAAGSIAQQADAGLRRLQQALGSTERSARAASEQLTRVNRSIREGHESVDVMAARLRVAGREMENYARHAANAEERQRRLNEANRQGSGGLGGIFSRFGSSLGEGVKDYALGAFAGGAGLAIVSGAADRARQAISDYREIQRADRFLQSQSRLTGTSYAQNEALAARLRGEFGTGQADTDRVVAQALAFTTAAGRKGDTERFLKSLGDLAVASGRDLKELPELIAQISAGTDEATDKLLQANPSQIYERYAASVGKTASALTDAEKKQSLLNAVIEKGSRVQGTANAALKDSLAGYDAAVQKLSDVAAKLAGVALGSKEAQEGIDGLRQLINLLDTQTSTGGLSGWLQSIGVSKERSNLGAYQIGEYARDALRYGSAAAAVRNAVRIGTGEAPDAPIPIASELGAGDAAKNTDALIRRLQAAARERRNREALQAAQIERDHQERLDRFASAGQPLAEIRAQYAARDRELAGQFDAGKLDRGNYARSLTTNAVERDVELARAQRDIGANLKRQLDQIKAEYAGNSNPIKQILMEGDIAARSLHDQLKKLGPEFAAQAAEIERESGKLGLQGFANALATGIRSRTSLNNRIREIEDAPFGEGRFAISPNEAAADQRALQVRGLARLLNQITGQSEPGPALDEQRQLFEDAQGLGGTGISRQAAINRLIEAAQAGKIDTSRITIDQQSFLQSIVTQRSNALGGYRAPQSAQERIQQAFRDAEEFASGLASSGQVKGSPEEQAAEIERRRRGFLLDALQGTNASEFAQSPLERGKYLEALTKERDESRQRDIKGLDYARRTAEALERLAPADGTPSKVAGANGDQKVKVDTTLNVNLRSRNRLVDPAVDGRPIDLTNMTSADTFNNQV